jgi:hypothetical protein
VGDVDNEKGYECGGGSRDYMGDLYLLNFYVNSRMPKN